jgi:hypothetical protein
LCLFILPLSLPLPHTHTHTHSYSHSLVIVFCAMRELWYALLTKWAPLKRWKTIWNLSQMLSPHSRMNIYIYYSQMHQHIHLLNIFSFKIDNCSYHICSQKRAKRELVTSCLWCGTRRTFALQNHSSTCGVSCSCIRHHWN